MSGDSSGDQLPDWYCPYKIPTEFSGALPPLVCLAGLDVENNQVHRGIWEMIKLKPSSKDFQPTYIDVPLDHKFPIKKQKSETVETYIPRGILKSNWINKHLQLIPSVVVAFFDMNWSDPHWSEKKNECAKRVRELKADLSLHGTQILVMLIKTADAGEDNFSTDRGSALCAAADIPPKALYILAHTHSERIQACVQRLELGMKEASKIYYTTRVRRVKNWKDRALNTALLARYNFKMGFFQEIRRDYMSALSHYHIAHETLQTIKVTESNIQQIRVISSWINYRICRLNLLKLDYKESHNQFDKHIRFFRKLEGNRELMFEQLAWLQQQFSYFGELLRHYYRPAATTLDPVTYFLSAVDYSDKRMTHCKALKTQDIKWPVEMNDFLNNCDVEFVGQRPWRQDAFGPDTVFVPEDSNAIQALKYLELRYKHSEDRITNLGIASDFCRDQQRLRTRCQLMMMMGIEFFSQSEYHRSIMLMTHVLREFGRDKGTSLLYLVADCGLRAACCDGDVAAYLSFLVFLMKRDFDGLVSDQRRELLWAKLLTVLDKRIPLPETDCVLNEEKWKSALAAPYVAYVGVHRECIVDGVFYFVNEAFKAAAPAEVRVVLTNNTKFPVAISKCGVGISITDYNCETTLDVTLQPGEVHELSLFFTPVMKDAGKIIQIHLGYIDIGKPDASVVLHYSALMGVSPYLWSDGKKDKAKQIIAKIEQLVPLLRPKITRDDPMLTNEWHKVLVSWTNTDTSAYSKIHLTFLVAASDPRDIVLTTDPTTEEKYGSLTHTVDVDSLASSASIDTLVYVKCLNQRGNELQFVTKAKYVDHARQAITNELVEPVEIIRSFEVSQIFRNLQTDQLGSVLSNEEFVGNFIIKNVSKCPIRIVNANLAKLSATYQMGNHEHAEINDLALLEGEVVQIVNTYTMTSPSDSPLGTMEITWRRENEDVPPCISSISISAVVSSPNAIYVEGICSNKGKGELKTPMPVKFIIHNRSNTVHDLVVSLDSTECFMNAGPKKTNVKITALEHVEMQYVLFPLKTGLVKTPRLLIEHVTGPNEGGGGEVPSVVHKNVVKYIFVTRPESTVEGSQATG